MRTSVDSLASTRTLLMRVRSGDPSGIDVLYRRYLPTLQRWASGRIPEWARSHEDTNDVVQVVLIQTFHRLESFEWEREGALLRYLRTAVRNRILDLVRRARVAPLRMDAEQAARDPGRSPLEEAVGLETLERYDDALAARSEQEQEAIILRIEMGYTWAAVAEAIGAPSADAARKIVSRAMVQVAKEMG